MNTEQQNDFFNDEEIKTISPWEEKEAALALAKHPLVDNKKRLILFLIGAFGLSNIIAPVVSSFLSIFGKNLTPIKFAGYANGFAYVVTFLIMLALVWEYRKDIWTQVKSGQTWLRGIGFGLLTIIAGAAIGILTNFIAPTTSSNVNQSIIELIIPATPVLSFLWIPFLGPIVEELTYRVGLFGALKSKDRTVAFVAVSIYFGLIHFNLPTQVGTNAFVALLAYGPSKSLLAKQFVNELINLPSYIISGLIFSIAYDQDGIMVPIIGHSLNNLLSYIFIIIGI